MGRGVSLQWLGDISLNGPFCDPQHAVALGENLNSIAAELGPCDLRVANWESPLWGDGRVNERKVPRVATLAHAAQAFMFLRLDVALLANNHAYDCLERGFDNTVAFLRDMGTVTLGAGRSAREAAEPLVLERRGVRLGLLNYVGHETHPNIPSTAGVFVNWFEEQRALSETSSLAADTDAVLVHLHWGADAFVRTPSVEQRRVARKLADAGARIVVGGHSHVLQGHERWGRGYIFHGMGNFVFWPSQRPLETTIPWPRFVREVGVACCRVDSAGVVDGSLRHLVQDGLALRWDETARRKRMERRLCRALRLSDAWFARARQAYAMHMRVQFRLRAMRRAGGFWSWLLAGLLRR